MVFQSADSSVSPRHLVAEPWRSPWKNDRSTLWSLFLIPKKIWSSAVEISSGNDQHSYWKWPSRNSEFSYDKWWFKPESIMLIYQKLSGLVLGAFSPHQVTCTRASNGSAWRVRRSHHKKFILSPNPLKTKSLYIYNIYIYTHIHIHIYIYI